MMRAWMMPALAVTLATGAMLATVQTGGAKPAAPARRAAPAWPGTVRLTPIGSHLLGNPGAKVKLVEYISYTCSHCAHFNQVSHGPLRAGYLRPGKVSVEIRNLVRDPVDLTAAILANCGTPAHFVGNHDMFLATQDRWMALVTKSTEDQRKRWEAGPLPARLKTIASDFGFYPMMIGRGYTRAQLDTCLVDPALLKRVVGMTDGAEKAGVNSTPSFMVNGTLADGHDWPSVETLVKAAL